MTTEQALTFLSQPDARVFSGDRILEAALAIRDAYIKLQGDHSWCDRVDRMSGASDDYEKDPGYHEMGH